MTEKNIDMFKLVQEVEKQRTVNTDDIFNDLDSLINEKNINTQTASTQNRSAETAVSGIIQKPVIPDQIGEYSTRFEAFKGIIEHVSYGTNNSVTYVEGHKDALEKYFKDAYNNAKDLYVIEARVNDEINRYNTHNQVYEKGYYDGLFYVLKALKRSKELLMAKLNREINTNL